MYKFIVVGSFMLLKCYSMNYINNIKTQNHIQKRKILILSHPKYNKNLMTLMKFSILFWRMAHFFDKHINKRGYPSYTGKQRDLSETKRNDRTNLWNSERTPWISLYSVHRKSTDGHHFVYSLGHSFRSVYF